MAISPRYDVTELPSQPGLVVAELIEAIGSDDFAPQLLRHLNGLDGIGRTDHFALYELSNERPIEIATASIDGTDTAHRLSQVYLDMLWSQDPMGGEIISARLGRAPRLYRMDVGDVPSGMARDIIYGETNVRHRLILCGSSSNSAVCMSIMRSGEKRMPDARVLDDLQRSAGTLIALAAKHIALWQKPSFDEAFASLRDIEHCIATANHHQLSRREAQVCARILYGQLTAGIALDLGIGEETVVTYRKRAYQRLGIATRQELLRWYIAAWTRLTSH